MTKKIRVLVDGHVFDGMFQGSRTFLKGLYAKLSESDRLDIYIAARDLDNLEREFSSVSGPLNFVKLGSESKVRRLLIEFPSLIKKYNFDYAHYQYIDPPLKLCRTIITIHDVLFLEFVDDFSWLYRRKKHFFKFSGARADILTTVSEYSRQAINRYLDIPMNNIHVVRPALENDFLKVLSDQDIQKSRNKVKETLNLDKYVLYVSRVEPRKNHDLLLRAYLELELWRYNYHLVFVGKTSIESKGLNDAYASIDSKIKQFLHHYESISHELLVELIRAASLFVYPTKAEGFGYPPLEAAALGVETLTSNATCLSEFKFFGDRFFNPDDIEELKRKMMAIISNSYKGIRIGDISRTICENFGWTNTAENMEKLICNDYRSNKINL